MTVPKALPPLTEFLLRQGAFASEKFAVVDVGASSGIDPRWFFFGDCLQAVGFDPLQQEVDRLNASNTHPGVRYVAAFVGSRHPNDLLPPETRQDKIHSRDNAAFERTSAARARDLLHLPEGHARFDETGSGDLTGDTLELSNYLDKYGPPSPDFVKVDTDGCDLAVLLSAERTLRHKAVLGLRVECQLHGPVHPRSFVFSNIDAFLRSCGFTLFDLVPFRQSRAVLPQRFVHLEPTQTVAGQVQWVEAFYFLDAGDPDFEKKWPVELSQAKLAKLVCLFEMHELGDCAAEVLLKYRNRLAASMDVDRCLDLLAGRAPDGSSAYPNYVACFERNPESFFPEVTRRFVVGDDAYINDLEDDVRGLEAQSAWQDREMAALRASLSWRITAPLRRVLGWLKSP